MAGANETKSVVQSVERALDLLVLIQRAQGPLSLSELATQSRLPSTTCYRLLSALQGRGFVEQRDGRGYQLGPMALGLGTTDRIKGEIVHVAAEHAAALSFDIQESVNLVVREGLHGVIVTKSEPTQPLRHTVPLGTTIPLHCTAAGKVLLAFAEEDLVAQLDAAGLLKPFTAKSLTSVSALREELESIQESGLSFDNEEHLAGLRCIGVPVRGAGGVVVAAISVAGPSARVLDKIPKITAKLPSVAAAISRALTAY